jgi:hypothetical protein
MCLDGVRSRSPSEDRLHMLMEMTEGGLRFLRRCRWLHPRTSPSSQQPSALSGLRDPRSVEPHTRLRRCFSPCFPPFRGRDIRMVEVLSDPLQGWKKYRRRRCEKSRSADRAGSALRGLQPARCAIALMDEPLVGDGHSPHGASLQYRTIAGRRGDLAIESLGCDISTDRGVG